MHNRNYTVRIEDEDEIEDELELKSGDVFSFNFNSDLSGYVIVNHQRQEDLNDPDTLFSVQSGFRIPAWMLVEFVGNHIADEMVESIEQMTGRELLTQLMPENPKETIVNQHFHS